MPGGPLGQFSSDYTSLGNCSVRNMKHAAVIPVCPIWLTFLKSALLYSLILVNNYITKVINSKYDSREEHQHICSHDNYFQKKKKEHGKCGKIIFY